MQNKPIELIVETANAAWNQALNSGDAKALAALYAEDATLSPGNGQILSGRTSIEALFQGFIDSGVHNHTLQIVATSGSDNMIYQVSRWTAEGAETEGNTPTFGGITMSVLEPGADGKWRASSHVWNAGA